MMSRAYWQEWLKKETSSSVLKSELKAVKEALNSSENVLAELAPWHFFIIFLVVFLLTSLLASHWYHAQHTHNV